MRVNLNIFLKIATILLLAGQAWAAPVLTYNTGVNTGSAGSPGSPETTGTVNTQWSLTSVTGAAAPSFATGDNQVRVGRHANWAGGGAATDSNWVVPYNTDSRANGLTGVGSGTFTYETTFNLAAYEASTAIISGAFGADNSAQILLNNNLLASTTGFGTTQWVSFNSGIDAFFLPGINTLRVIVNNTGGASGFRVEYTVTADSRVPEIDTSTASLPLALVVLGFLVLSDRRRNAQLNV